MRIKTIIFQIICLLVTVTASAQTFTLHGRVTDENNDPIEFASVSCLKQGKMTMTSLKGEYSMQLHSADSVVIKFSMIGYKAKTRVLRRPRGSRLCRSCSTQMRTSWAK